MCLVQRPGNTNSETFSTIAATGRTVKTVDCDLADLDAVRTLFARALEVMQGQIHVLVNCAGIQRRSPAVSFSEQDWDDVRTQRFLSFSLLTICYHLCNVLLFVPPFMVPSAVVLSCSCLSLALFIMP